MRPDLGAGVGRDEDLDTVQIFNFQRYYILIHIKNKKTVFS